MVIMPTVVAKGAIFAQFDRYLETSERQIAVLKALRATIANSDNPVDELSSGSFGLGSLFPNQGDVDHTNADWFGIGKGARSSFFRTLDIPEDPNNPGVVDVDGYAAVGAPTDSFVQKAQFLLTTGMIEALEVALGIGDGEAPWTDPAWLMPTDKPVEILWVCGKGGGFECQVIFNSRQVTLCLVTPPVKYMTEALDETLDRVAAKRDRARRGMIAVVPTGPAKPTGEQFLQPKRVLMKKSDGGLD